MTVLVAGATLLGALRVPTTPTPTERILCSCSSCLVRGQLQRILRSGSSHLNLSMHRKTQELILNKLKQGKRLQPHSFSKGLAVQHHTRAKRKGINIAHCLINSIHCVPLHHLMRLRAALLRWTKKGKWDHRLPFKRRSELAQQPWVVATTSWITQVAHSVDNKLLKMKILWPSLTSSISKPSLASWHTNTIRRSASSITRPRRIEGGR